MANKPCLVCGRPTRASRCPAHQTPNPTYQETQRRRRAVENHRDLFGGVCPGWDTPPHPTNDLTADHINPRVRYTDDGALQVLCRQCNSRKRDT